MLIAIPAAVLLTIFGLEAANEGQTVLAVVLMICAGVWLLTPFVRR